MFREYFFDTARESTVIFFPGDLNRGAADVVSVNCVYQPAETVLARTIAPFVERRIACKKIRHVKCSQIELIQNIRPSFDKSFPSTGWAASARNG